jgi:hypothetical protein
LDPANRSYKPMLSGESKDKGFCGAKALKTNVDIYLS